MTKSKFLLKILYGRFFNKKNKIINVKRNDGFERLFTRSTNHERLTPPAADPTLRCRPGLTYKS